MLESRKTLGENRKAITQEFICNDKWWQETDHVAIGAGGQDK
jgi:hypothetical protein